MSEELEEPEESGWRPLGTNLVLWISLELERCLYVSESRLNQTPTDITVRVFWEQGELNSAHYLWEERAALALPKASEPPNFVQLRKQTYYNETHIETRVNTSPLVGQNFPLGGGAGKEKGNSFLTVFPRSKEEKNASSRTGEEKGGNTLSSHHPSLVRIHSLRLFTLFIYYTFIHRTFKKQHITEKEGKQLENKLCGKFPLSSEHINAKMFRNIKLREIPRKVYNP